jgi:hypothetical protein
VFLAVIAEAFAVVSVAFSDVIAVSRAVFAEAIAVSLAVIAEALAASRVAVATVTDAWRAFAAVSRHCALAVLVPEAVEVDVEDIVALVGVTEPDVVDVWAKARIGKRPTTAKLPETNATFLSAFILF